MKLSLGFAPLALQLACAALAGCAASHPPPVSAATVTSTQVARPAPIRAPSSWAPLDDDTFAPTLLPPMSEWAWRYPDAAAGAGRWALAHPETAHALRAWQRSHPEQAEALIDWAADDQAEPLGAFLMNRSGWSQLAAIAGGSDDLRGFLAWVRNAPGAARELAFHTDGLSFVEDNAGALSRMSHSEAIMRSRPVMGRAARGAIEELPASPLLPSPKNEATRGGAGVPPP